MEHGPLAVGMLREEGVVILLCYTGMLNSRVVDALPHDQPKSLVEIDPNDKTAYARHLHLAWAMCANAKEDLVTIEHDIVIHDGVFPTFKECEDEACAFFYWIGSGYEIGLGCSRFKNSLIREFPHTIELASKITDDLLPEGDWRRLDTRVWRTLNSEGILPCRHGPPVEHLHEYPRPPEPFGA